MAPITDYSNYDEFITPGLYHIINKSSETFLDLSESKAAAGTDIIGFKSNGRDNQKWNIADLGNGTYLIICRKTGTYLRAVNDGKAVKSSVGYPDHSDVHWKISKPDAKNPELTEFYSAKFQGDVLELKGGADADSTEVLAYAQDSAREGQKWLLQKLAH